MTATSLELFVRDRLREMTRTEQDQVRRLLLQLVFENAGLTDLEMGHLENVLAGETELHGMLLP